MVVSAAVLLPTYFYKCLHHWSSIKPENIDFYSISTAQALALLPSHIIGNIIPFVLVELPWRSMSADGRHLLILGWLLAAAWTFLIQTLLGYLFKKYRSSKALSSRRHPIRALRLAYISVITLSLAWHWFTLCVVFWSPEVRFSLKIMFMPEFIVDNFPDACFVFLKWDGLFLYGTSVSWAYYTWRQTSGWEPVGWAVPLTCFFGSFLMSPGAVIGGLMWWREEFIYRGWTVSGNTDAPKKVQ